MRETLYKAIEYIFHQALEYLCWYCVHEPDGKYCYRDDEESPNIESITSWDYRPKSPRLISVDDNRWIWKISPDLVRREPGETASNYDLRRHFVTKSHVEDVRTFQLIEKVICSYDFLIGDLSQKTIDILFKNQGQSFPKSTKSWGLRDIRLHTSLLTESYRFLLAPHTIEIATRSSADQLLAKRLCEETLGCIYPKTMPWVTFIWPRMYLGEALRVEKGGILSFDEDQCDDCLCKLLVVINAIGYREVARAYQLMRIVVAAVIETSDRGGLDRNGVATLLEELFVKYAADTTLRDGLNELLLPRLVATPEVDGQEIGELGIVAFENGDQIKLSRSIIESTRSKGSKKYTLTLDCLSRQLWFFNKKIPVTPLGFNLLLYLSKRPPGQVINYDDILKDVLKGVPDPKNHSQGWNRIQNVLRRSVRAKEPKLKNHIVVEPKTGLKITSNTSVLVIERKTDSEDSICIDSESH